MPHSGVSRATAGSRSRTRRLLLLAGVLAIAVPVPVLALPPAPSTVLTAPPLPPQPAVPASSCLAQPPPPGWALVARQRATASVPLDGGPSFPAPGYQVAVDPQLPCRMFRARDAQTLERSLDAGRTWTTVFHDAAVEPYAATDPTCSLSSSGCALSSPPFTASGIDLLSSGVPGLVALGERGNGDAAVVSYDSGTTWSLMGGAGLSGHRVLHLRTARDGDPSHAVFGYAVVELAPGSGTPIGLDAQTVYVTSDSGATWQPTVWPGAPGAASGPPPARIDAMSVVPQLPSQVLCVANGTLYAGMNGSTPVSPPGGPSITVTASSSQPMVWRSLGPVPDTTTLQLVLMPAGSSVRAFTLGGNGDLHYADVSLLSLQTAGVTASSTTAAPPVWHPVAIPTGVRVTAVAMSPFGNQILVAGTDASQRAGHRVRVFYGTGAAGSVREIAAPPSTGSADASVRTPLLPAADAPPPPDAVLQADDSGSFYLETAACLAADTTCRAEEQSFWRYTPPPLPPPARGGTDAGNGGGSQLPAEPLTELAACALGSAGESSPLGFDGVNLIYPDPALVERAPYTDIVEALDTRTCLTTPPRAITVHFDPAETRYTFCSDGPCPTIRIDDLTYDARRHVIWFVAYGNTSTGTESAAVQAGPFDRFLFTAPWPTLDQPAVTDVQAHVAFLPAHHENGCGGNGGGRPAYQVSDDSLWTCSYDAEGSLIGDHIRAADGSNIPDHCYPGFMAWQPSYAGSPGHLYAWSEDDTTIDDVSPVTCNLTQLSVHPPVAEPLQEDEQLVCDPLTFTHLRGWPGLDTTVFWLRESGLDRVEAFASSSATCPLPTALAVLAPLTVGCGATLALTVQLRLEGPGLPIAGQLVTFSMGGVPAGSAMTGSDGRARLVLAAPMTAGQDSVTVSFSGTDRLYPSTAGATVTLHPDAGCSQPVGAVRPQPAVPLGPFAASPPPPMEPLPVPHPAPGSEPAAQPAVNPGAQAQMEAQAQVQSVAQSQPGMMVQPQVRRRLATRTSREARVAASLADVRGLNPTEVSGFAAVAAAAWWCWGWMPRRRFGHASTSRVWFRR